VYARYSIGNRYQRTAAEPAPPGNYAHLLVETLNANLAEGMKWLLSVYYCELMAW
jgi:hypothetical protein